MPFNFARPPRNSKLYERETVERPVDGDVDPLRIVAVSLVEDAGIDWQQPSLEDFRRNYSPKARFEIEI
jgi:hypothetical protein